VAGAVVLLAAVAACKDSNAPESLPVTLTAQVVGPPDLTSPADSIPRILCHVSFTAILNETATKHAGWAGGMMRFAYGDNRTVFRDSTAISVDDVTKGWGNAGLTGGVSQTSGWYFYAGAPFTVQVEFRFQDANAKPAGSASAIANCGPILVPGTAPPTVAVLDFLPAVTTLQPGDSMGIRYEAFSPLGIWASTVSFSGPCVGSRRFADRLLSPGGHVGRFGIPATCSLNFPLTLDVVVFDGGLQSTHRTVTTSTVLVDQTAPTLALVFYPPDGSGAKTDISGNYSVGDTLRFLLTATDNRAVQSIVWELPSVGAKDSILGSGTRTSVDKKIGVPPGWSGATGITFYARDITGLASTTINSTTFTIH
jgi:hypothetical protein